MASFWTLERVFSQNGEFQLKEFAVSQEAHLNFCNDF